jgi:excinuclease ABC subunit C
LHLQRTPHRIECVDISHLGGGDTVGAISVVIDGRISRQDGRTYHVRTVKSGDDYQAITEVLSRRFYRAKNREEGWSEPDLLVVDGGRSHLNAARAVLAELGFESQPVVALAKERSARENADGDRVYLPGRKNPIALKTSVSSLQLLAMSRDEAHRLANAFQRKTRRKAALKSKLDSIDGIGPKLRNKLLRQLGSVKRIRRASLDEIAGVPGVGQALAARIKEALGSGGS